MGISTNTEAGRDAKRAYQRLYQERNVDKVRAQRAKYRRENPDAVKRSRKKYQQSGAGRRLRLAHYAEPRIRMRILAERAEIRARRNGLEFSEAVRETVIKDPPRQCACCSRTFDYSVRGKGAHDGAPSIDRVDNRLGYTTDNTAVICMRCNRRKSDATLSELEMIIRYMREHQEETKRLIKCHS